MARVGSAPSRATAIERAESTAFLMRPEGEGGGRRGAPGGGGAGWGSTKGEEGVWEGPEGYSLTDRRGRRPGEDEGMVGSSTGHCLIGGSEEEAVRARTRNANRFGWKWPGRIEWCFGFQRRCYRPLGWMRKT